MQQQDIDGAQRIADAVKNALDNARDSGYDELNEDSGDIAENMNMCDADLENVPASLLIPHIEQWQKHKCIELNVQAT